MRTAVIFLLGGAVAAAFTLVSNSQSAATLTLGLVLSGIEIYLLNKAANGFTAAAIPVIVVNVTLLAALLCWQEVIELAATTTYAAAILPGDADSLISAAVIGIAFSAAYTAGALVAGPRNIRVSAEQIGLAISQIGKTIKLPNVALVIIGYAGIFLAVYAWQGALIQGRYIEHGGPAWAVSLSSITIPLSLLAFMLMVVGRGPWRGLAFLGLGLLLVILFARATRALVMFPLMLALTRALLPNKRLRGISLILILAAAVFSLQIPMVGRRNPDGVGIVPLGRILFSHPQEFFSQIDIASVAGNVLFSAPLTAAVAERHISSTAFWTSVNPLPSGMTAWTDIRRSLRINYYTPYSALGELAAQGWLVLVVSAGAAGFILALATRIASSFPGNFRIAAVILVLAIISLFAFSILQYNLRASARLVWYSLVSVGAIWLATISLGPRLTQAGKGSSPSESVDGVAPRGFSTRSARETQ